MIVHASIADGLLHVVSSEPKHLVVSLREIPALAGRETHEQSKFEIDEDGSFLFWPTLDVHLGWEQLQQINDPKLAVKAKQRTKDFNIHYGKAIRVAREKAGLKSVPGLSDALLHQIETGKCRVTSKIIETMAKAHQVSPNEYLRLLAETTR